MLKRVQHDRILVQFSAKLRTKVQKADCEPSAELFRQWQKPLEAENVDTSKASNQEKTSKSQHSKPALNSQQVGIIANKNTSKLS